MSPFRHASNAVGGITIDLKRMDSVALVNPDGFYVNVGAGAVWADVYRTLDPMNLSAVWARNSLTGVTGSILGVVEFEIVLANSSIVTVTQTDHADLFFALRGGGNNFGIVTHVTIEAFQDPPTWYTFQLWDMGILGVIFRRLEKHTTTMPSEVWQISVTLGWHIPSQEFVISERTVATEAPLLPASLPFPGSELSGRYSPALKTHVYQRSILEMSQKINWMNPPGFYNYFGSVTVKNNAGVFLALADVFCHEVHVISDVGGLQVNIVYNPLTAETIRQMPKRGGNSLGIEVDDGPLTSHWRGFTQTRILPPSGRAIRSGGCASGILYSAGFSMLTPFNYFHSQGL